MWRTLILLFIFSIAMGFMESAIVIYLRELYYPAGFNFPLTVIPPNIAIVEITREAATLIMLLTIALLTGRTTFQRLAYFLFCFAVWDLFYYIFLKIFLNWPESLFTWDILFLIPVPWIGPVIAPCILSLTMITLTLLIPLAEKNKVDLTLKKSEWSLFILGTVTIIYSFITDYIGLASKAGSGLSAEEKQNLFSEFGSYVPHQFNWVIFFVGEFLLILAILKILIRIRRKGASRKGT
jgi:hypothetical protein